ncbi:hypothetical protein RB213_010282 [Colletotrichum asianum]
MLSEKHPGLRAVNPDPLYRAPDANSGGLGPTSVPKSPKGSAPPVGCPPFRSLQQGGGASKLMAWRCDRSRDRKCRFSSLSGFSLFSLLRCTNTPRQGLSQDVTMTLTVCAGSRTAQELATFHPRGSHQACLQLSSKSLKHSRFAQGSSPGRFGGKPRSH